MHEKRNNIPFLISGCEARIAMNKAVYYLNLNNSYMENKMIQHAIAITKINVHVLIYLEHGRHLEAARKFHVASSYYYSALLIQPNNAEALQAHQRVLPQDSERDAEMIRKIDEKLKDLKRFNKDIIYENFDKRLYFEHILNTIGIEGSSVTLSETEDILSNMPVLGLGSLEYNEVLSMDAALKFLNGYLISKDKLTMFDILELHKYVMSHEPEIAGLFRDCTIVVGDPEHCAPPVYEVGRLMNNFIQLLQSPYMQTLHPIQAASLVHHDFVYIHPFEDGNGRTGRLLMNYILKRFGYPPIIIKKEERDLYFACLYRAHQGDLRPFIRFIASCMEETIDLMQTYTKTKI